MIKHIFVSDQPDDTNPDHVQGTHWNADHDIDDPDALAGVLPVFTSSTKGLAPSSGGGASNFLRADGTWAAPPASTPPQFSTSVDGIVPASGSGSTYLKGDGSWSNATVLTAFINTFTTALKGSVAASGSASTYLKGDGSWSDATALTAFLSTFTTSLKGLAPASGAAATYLKGDGSWSNATTLTAFLNAFSTTLAGLVPASGGGTINFLRADGSFVPSVASNAGDPTGSITAAKGALIRDTTNGQLYINTDGSTTWSRLARADVISVKSLGDGADGAAVFDGSTAVAGFTGPTSNVYTAARETAFTTGTFSPGVVLDMTTGGAIAGFRIFFNGTVTVTSGTATIKYNGIAAAGTIGGTGLGANPQGNSSASGAGSNQNAGSTGSNSSAWTNRIKGGTGGAGGSSPTNISGAGGTVTTTFTAAQGDILTWEQGILSRLNLSNSGIISGGAGGGSGAGTVGVASGGAGGGGAGIGVVGIAALASTGTLVIEARGGTGSNGASGGGSNTAGGGGGGGGVLFVAFGGSTQPGNLTIQAPGGAPGSPQGLGNAGVTGGTGTIKFFPLGQG